VVGNWKTVNGCLIVEFGFFSFSGLSCYIGFDVFYTVKEVTENNNTCMENNFEV